MAGGFSYGTGLTAQTTEKREQSGMGSQMALRVDIPLRVALRDALACPESYPGHLTAVEVRETHISWVFLAGDRAYKLKKPVVLDFLDYGTAERRRAMCETEVVLNRRLAPEVYLGVRGVALADGVAKLTAPDDARAVDFVVEMRRYEERDTLASRLQRGELRVVDVEAVARALASFHAGARPVEGLARPLLTVERRFDRNLHELLSGIEQRGEIGRVLALERFAHAFITAHSQELRRRAGGGAVREGHGDLRAEHVIVGERVEIVDCVEFDAALREVDVGDDLAFLAFDLAARGGARFGAELVRAYREAGGDPGPDSLVAFYAAYRALVRAKVALVRASELASGGADHGRESARARDLIAVAERFAWQARLPLLIVVCGVPASGKSHLARALSELSGLRHLSSDVTRKMLGGVSAAERLPARSYGADWNARTYRELGRRANASLTAHGGAVIDATFRHALDRQSFAGALDGSAPRLFVECRAPACVLVKRAAQRERDPQSTSDAGFAVVAREQTRWQPLDEVPADAHLIVRTDRPISHILADVIGAVDERLLGRR